MKICFITAWGFAHLDGSNLRTYFLLKELLKRGHQVTVVHASQEDAEFTKTHFSCNAVGVGVKIDRWDSHQKKIFKYIRFVREARKTVKNIECDIVFGISLINSMAAVSNCKKEAVIMYVDFMSNYYNYAHPKGPLHLFLYLLGRTLERHTIKKAARVITITNAMKNLMPEECFYKISVIPDGADTQKFVLNTDKSAKALYNLKDNDFVIGYQGGIEAHDGLQFLALAAPEIVKKIPQVHFLIAGRGGYLEKVKKIVEDNKLSAKFTFTGWVKSDEIPKIMAATDLNIVPIPNHPATSVLITFRLLESMAAGVNVMINDLPGMREIVDESMVFFTDVEKPLKFAQDILKAINTPIDKRLEMIKNARKKIETLDWRAVAKMDADVLELKKETK